MHTRVMSIARAAATALGWVLIGSSPLQAQIAPASGCADCHVATPAAPAASHVSAWDRSPPGRANVGCQACKAGNPGPSEPALAHRGILPPADRKSPVHRLNIPATCGSCHRGQFAAFQDSRHYKLLRSGNDEGPTCVTCHGEVDG